MSKLLVKWLFVCLAALLAAPHAEARHRPRLSTIEGNILEVDRDATPPTVTIDREDDREGPDEVTLEVTRLTRIEVDDERGSLADLRAGLGVEARYDRRTGLAYKIEVEEDPDVESAVGRVLSATPDSITLDTEDGDVTLDVDAQTLLRLGVLRLRRSEIDLLEGLRARAEFDRDSFLAYEVEGLLPAVQYFTGEVTEVDLDDRVLVVDNGRDEVEFVVPEDADIRLLGQQLRLPAVQVGDRVTIAFVENGNDDAIALRIGVLAQPRHVTGNLIDVDEDDETITLRARGGEITLVVTPETSLKVNGRDADLEDLADLLDESRRRIRVSAQYIERGDEDIATRVRVNARGKRRGHDRDDDRGRGRGRDKDKDKDKDKGKGNGNGRGNGRGRGR